MTKSKENTKRMELGPSFKCPCKDCITFAICNATIRAAERRADITTHAINIDCEILIDYIGFNKNHNHPYSNYFQDRVNATRVLFGLDPTVHNPQPISYYKGKYIWSVHVKTVYVFPYADINHFIIYSLIAF